MAVLLYAAILLSGHLYLGGVYVAGLLTHEPLAWKGALITVGANYLVFLLQTVARAPHQRALISILVAITIVLGAASGLALLVFA